MHWGQNPPDPAVLCRLAGIEGVYFRRLSDQGATVALWGQAATEVGQRYSAGDLLHGTGPALLHPLYSGDNPWPEMPGFPPSHGNPGLSSVSYLERTAPALRTNGRGGMVFGRDPERQPVGFSLPGLEGMALLRIHGQAATDITVDLVSQALRIGLPTAFLDGAGVAAARVVRQAIRAVADGQILTCDVERPGQSRFRLNPLHLPPEQPEAWPQILGEVWPGWLRELGVTPAGLGAAAYRHSQMAVMVTALLAARRQVTLDPAILWEALESPDFLAAAGVGGPEMFGREMWQWWLEEGRPTHNFDVHLRLGHLRERLNALLDLPEYQVLWRKPYLDPAAAFGSGKCLIWRLPDPRRRLRGYITSQVTALASQLAARPTAAGPVLIVLHELDVEPWVKRLAAFPAARVVAAARRLAERPLDGGLLLSRLDRADAERVENEAAPAGIRAADLRRLPEGRLVMRRDEHIGTIDVE